MGRMDYINNIGWIAIIIIILLSISSGFIRFNLITELFRAIITVLLLTDKSIMLDGGLKLKPKNIETT